MPGGGGAAARVGLWSTNGVLKSKSVTARNGSDAEFLAKTRTYWLRGGGIGAPSARRLATIQGKSGLVTIAPKIGEHRGSYRPKAARK